MSEKQRGGAIYDGIYIDNQRVNWKWECPGKPAIEKAAV